MEFSNKLKISLKKRINERDASTALRVALKLSNNWEFLQKLVEKK